MKIILSHPTGNANVRAAANGLADAGMLEKFCTTIASFPGNWLDRVSVGPLAEIKRRQYDNKLRHCTDVNPWFEAGRLIAPKIGLKKLTRHEVGSLSIDAIYRNNDKRLAAQLKYYKKGQTAVYAYEDGARYSFAKAKQVGLSCYYDLPIGYWKAARRLLEQEIKNWPEWADTLTGFHDSDLKLLNKDEELRLADHIFVASTFTAKTLKDFSGNLAQVTVIPYGFPQATVHREYATINRPLRLLFVGGLSQRKGIANLFAAVGAFGSHVQLTVVGGKASDNCEALDNALAQYHWIPSLPHHEILNLMKAHDVLLFPSLFEGFGLVITEAMSQGTPVITTERTAGPDLIQHDHNGWLIKAGSTQAIKEVIEDLLSNPQKIRKAGQEAMQTALKRPWDMYGQELAAAISAL